MSGCLHFGCAIGVPACAGSWMPGLTGPSEEVSKGALMDYRSGHMPSNCPCHLWLLTNPHTPPKPYKVCGLPWQMWSSCSGLGARLWPLAFSALPTAPAHTASHLSPFREPGHMCAQRVLADTSGAFVQGYLLSSVVSLLLGWKTALLEFPV